MSELVSICIHSTVLKNMTKKHKIQKLKKKCVKSVCHPTNSKRPFLKSLNSCQGGKFKEYSETIPNFSSFDKKWSNPLVHHTCCSYSENCSFLKAAVDRVLGSFRKPSRLTFSVNLCTRLSSHQPLCPGRWQRQWAIRGTEDTVSEIQLSRVLPVCPAAGNTRTAWIQWHVKLQTSLTALTSSFPHPVLLFCKWNQKNAAIWIRSRELSIPRVLSSFCFSILSWLEQIQSMSVTDGWLKIQEVRESRARTAPHSRETLEATRREEAWYEPPCCAPPRLWMLTHSPALASSSGHPVGL